MEKEHLANLFLRIGLAFVFLYAGISIIANPTAWIGFLPDFIDIFFSKRTLLYIHAGLDILLGLWLLSNKNIFYASLLSALNILGIIVFNLGALDIIFRDIAIFFTCLALAILNYKKQLGKE